ncbi:MAG: GNAT family N-acetyltransferase [Pirellulaceae bacterium]|nr:GNAT family N-acetyltransferase [Pirellulaceae bacterium]
MTALRISEIAHGSTEYDATVELRRRWLREPLGLHFTAEELAADARSRHLAAYLADELVGCVVITPIDEQTMRMRQLIVRPDRQGQGVGTALIERAETVAREAACTRMVLHARATAIALYKRLGYRDVGEPFIEVGIPHQAMEKAIAFP